MQITRVVLETCAYLGEFELPNPPVASRLLTMVANKDSTFDVKDQNQKLKFVLEPQSTMAKDNLYSLRLIRRNCRLSQ